MPTPVSLPPLLESGCRFCPPKTSAEIRQRLAVNSYVNLPLPERERVAKDEGRRRKGRKRGRKREELSERARKREE